MSIIVETVELYFHCYNYPQMNVEMPFKKTFVYLCPLHLFLDPSMRMRGRIVKKKKCSLTSCVVSARLSNRIRPLFYPFPLSDICLYAS